MDITLLELILPTAMQWKEASVRQEEIGIVGGLLGDARSARAW